MKTITLITAVQRLTLCLLVGSLLAFSGTSLATERVTYYHNDALGSPVAATDANGTLLWREEYAPYGERLAKEAGSKDTIWYTGKQEESTFGLSYFGARWYDPKVGRFMGVDSAGFIEDNIHSYSKYAYANNNPYLYVDPDGNFAFLVPLAIFIAKEVAAEGFSQLTGLPNLSVKGLVKSGAKGIGKLLGKSKVRKDVTKSAGSAKNPVNGLKLNKQLGSQQQLGEKGITFAGPGAKRPFRDADRAARDHGGNPSDFVKKRSSAHTAPDGTKFRTHFIENTKTGQRFEHKTKLVD